MSHYLGVERQKEILNTIANRDDVLPHVAPGYRFVDLSNFFNNPNNVMYGNETGVILFGEREPDVYEAHFLLGSEIRGKNVLDASRSALQYMFTDKGAKAIIGETPATESSARAVNRALGFTPTGTSVLPDGRPCVVYKLERAEWEALSGA